MFYLEEASECGLDEFKKKYNKKLLALEEFNNEFSILNKMIGESLFSYIFSLFYFFKISHIGLGKKYVFLSWNEKN